jgi:O-succinylbenzoate synthase
MKIERITLTHVSIPLVEPFRISNGEVRDKDGIIVSVYSDGVVGHGEASPMRGSFYSADTPDSVWEYLTKELIPKVVATSPASIEEINALLDEHPGSPFGKAGVETAYWDLIAQQQNKPLFTLLGGKKGSIASGLAVGIYPTVEQLLASVERHMAEGYKRLKIKIEPGWDVKPLEAIRKRFGAIPLMVDANCAYSQNDFALLKTLDEFDLMMIEQPLPRTDLEGHAKLQAQVKTPICLDESAEDLGTVRRAVEMQACKIVNIKIQRVGGLKNAKEIHDLCAKAQIPVWAGTMPELGIGSAQTLHLATLPNFSYPTDVESTRRWFEDDIIEPYVEVRNGMIQIVEGTGNCYQLNESMIKKYTIREAAFQAR